MRLAVLAVALALASPALADEPEPGRTPEGDGASAAAEGSSPPAAPPPARPRPGGGSARWGLVADAGFPEGAALSAVFRPVPSVRFFAGPAWNYVGFGVQGGVAVVPWHFALTPVLSAEVGRYFGADVSFVASNGQGVPPELKPLLEDMSYSYGAVHAGIELGSQSRLAFSIRAGLAYVSLKARGTVTSTDSGSGTTVEFRDPRVRGTLPSVKLGLHYWF
jgi:hypothetical protein